ncbi:hypothetical protein [Acinetobacter junii]|uniref:hypothetical protein n=1 Tax=Acinetobacter junii TaxID=40215 RepID=UPI002090DC99|nr:hypothetical protein [Acinetobacter junii]USR74243.1 hypothetical protein NGM19_04635 [Acinetobacter junii]
MSVVSVISSFGEAVPPVGEPENESDPDPLLRLHYLHGFKRFQTCFELADPPTPTTTTMPPSRYK